MMHGSKEKTIMDRIQDFMEIIPQFQVLIGLIGGVIALLGLVAFKSYTLFWNAVLITMTAILIGYYIGRIPGGPYYSSSDIAPQATQVAGQPLYFKNKYFPRCGRYFFDLCFCASFSFYDSSSESSPFSQKEKGCSCSFFPLLSKERIQVRNIFSIVILYIPKSIFTNLFRELFSTFPHYLSLFHNKYSVDIYIIKDSEVVSNDDNRVFCWTQGL